MIGSIADPCSGVTSGTTKEETMLKTTRKIKCEDTGKEYTMGEKGTPQLWAVRLQIGACDSRSGNASFTSHGWKEVHCERETLLKCGLLPLTEKEKKEVMEETSVIDLVTQLLEHVGVFPEQ